MSAIARVRLSRFAIRRLPRPRPPRPRTVLAFAFVLALLGGGWLWLRDSSLVSVERVTVTGLSGPQASRIQLALQSAARSMTTLDVNMSALRIAVAPFPVVKSLSVSTQFPHGMRIRVHEQVAVGAVTVDGRRIAVAGDGTLLPSVNASGLASVPVSVPPGGTRLTDAGAQGSVAVLAAAPDWLRARVAQVSRTTANGLVARMRNGPEIYFGAAIELRAKWLAAAAVLADPSSQGAGYIDVTVPERPVAGPAAATTDQSATPTSSTSTAGATSATGATTGGTATPTGAVTTTLGGP